MKSLDDPVEAHESDVGRVLRLGDAEGRRVREQDVELAARLDAFQADPKLEAEAPPPHLSLGVLVRARLVAKAATQARDAKAMYVHHPTVDVLASLWAGHRNLMVQRHPRRIRALEA